MEGIRRYTSQFPSEDIESFCSVLEDWFTRNSVAKFVVEIPKEFPDVAGAPVQVTSSVNPEARSNELILDR